MEVQWKEHHAFAVKGCISSGFSLSEAYRRLYNRYGIRRLRDVPSINLIQLWVARFSATGSLLNKAKQPANGSHGQKCWTCYGFCHWKSPYIVCLHRYWGCRNFTGNNAYIYIHTYSGDKDDKCIKSHYISLVRVLCAISAYAIIGSYFFLKSTQSNCNCEFVKIRHDGQWLFYTRTIE